MLIQEQTFDILLWGGRMKTVKELKQEIEKVIKPGYTYQTNLSWTERLISINHGVGIGAKLVQKDNKMVYEFIVDTQFVSSKEITYDEICMCKDIIDILEKNRNFVLKRLKKYTVEEYEQEQLERKQKQESFIKFLDSLVYNSKSRKDYEDYEFVEDRIDIEEDEA